MEFARWEDSAAHTHAVQQGAYFDAKAADAACAFFENELKHTKGRWAGQPFILLPWQRDEVMRPLYGWKDADGNRLFRKAYIEIPKKNGKSTQLGGMALKALVADGEPGPEVYLGASDKDQAGIIYNESAAQVNQSDNLSKVLKVVDSKKRIVYPKANGFLRVISADAHRQEGLNSSFTAMDELHAQPNRKLFDCLNYAGAARKQPMLVSITTAGYDRHSICYEQHDYSKKVLSGVIKEDIRFFPYIRAASEKDDWTDPAVWAKANPSLGETIDVESFRSACVEAQQSPAKENAFKRYRLNIWTEQATRWLQMAKWDECAGQVLAKALKGQRCFGGLDLSSTTDTSAFVLYFPDSGAVLCWFWLPEENAEEQANRDRAPYMEWAKAGHLELTPGNVIDYAFIRKRINALSDEYDISAIAFDPWNASHLCESQLLHEDGLPMVKMRQGYVSMSAPTKELEKLVLSGALAHGGNPVLRYHAGNAAVRVDASDNMKIDKERATERVDGVVALVMAVGRSMADVKKTSPYAERGILTL